MPDITRRRSSFQTVDSVDSWLSELPVYWPTELHHHVADFSSPAPLLKSARGRKRTPSIQPGGSQRLHKKNRMEDHDQDAASVASTPRSLLSSSTRTSSHTVFSNRPILTPKPPSRRASRSPSPVRTTLLTLERATPPVKIRKPSKDTQQPTPVIELRKFLTEGFDKAIIPKGLESRLREIDLDEIDGMHDGLFDGDDIYTTEQLDALWIQIQQVYNEASICHNRHKDENAWVQVVRSMLYMTGLHSTSVDLEVNSVQSQSIDSQYLPILPNQTSPLSKKADLAIALSPCKSQASWLDRNPGSTLSHLTDPHTSSILIACPIEIKKLGGDYEEAVCQMGVWLAAALDKMQSLQHTRNTRPDEFVVLTPILGWTVVGHDWALHIAWKDASGTVMVFGPYKLLNASTSSYIDIFRLRRLIEVVKKWLLTRYRSWCFKELLGIE